MRGERDQRRGTEKREHKRESERERELFFCCESSLYTGSTGSPGDAILIPRYPLHNTTKLQEHFHDTM